MEINVTADMREVDRSLRKMEPCVRSAIVGTLNKTATHVKSKATKSIAAKVKVPQKHIKARVNIQKAGKLDMSVRLNINLLPIGIIEMKPKEKKKGIGITNHIFPSAFFATMKSGHKGVFKRVGKRRLPIKEVKIAINPPAEIHFRYAALQGRLYFKSPYPVGYNPINCGQV